VVALSIAIEQHPSLQSAQVGKLELIVICSANSRAIPN
jgi:hypothetical protein